jgi:hypothetical protein
MIETQSHEDTKKILENPLSYKIIGAAIEVHRTLGGTAYLKAKDHPIHEAQFLRNKT